jgi:hypothetical protein
LQSGKQFPFHPALKIGAGLGCRHIKLGRNGKSMPHDAES